MMLAPLVFTKSSVKRAIKSVWHIPSASVRGCPVWLWHWHHVEHWLNAIRVLMAFPAGSQFIGAVFHGWGFGLAFPVERGFPAHQI